MNTGELLEAFREETRDTEEPYLWSDKEIFRYMTEAQRMFCRLTWGIADTRSRVCRISYLKGENEVHFDPRILKIRDIRRGDGRKVELQNIETYHCPRDAQGKPDAAVVDIDMNMMRLFPTPDEDGELELMVNRLPLFDPDAINGLEINEQHHWSLLLWMKHLAYLKTDAETFDKARSAEFGLMFRQYCDQAKHEREMREHRYRTVSYGGI